MAHYCTLCQYWHMTQNILTVLTIDTGMADTRYRNDWQSTQDHLTIDMWYVWQLLRGLLGYHHCTAHSRIMCGNGGHKYLHANISWYDCGSTLYNGGYLPDWS